MPETKDNSKIIDNAKKIPVTIITGFLGAGKTTLLKHILTHKHGKKIAVIENEFAQSIGVSNELHGADEGAVCVAEVFETANGCICCGSKDEFVSTLYQLFDYKDRIDYIIVETTGRADPAFVQVFEMDPNIKQHMYVDGIVTLVDAQNALSHLSKERATWKGTEQIINEAVEQVAVADRVIVNKTDLVTKDDVTKIQDQIRSINPFTQIYTSEYSQVEVSHVLDVRAFDIEKVLKQDKGFLDMRPYRQHNNEVQPHNFEGIGEVDLEEFRGWMTKYLKANEVLRAKGVIHVTGKSEKYVFQSVRDMLDIYTFGKWGEKDAPTSKLVFIGKNLNTQELVENFPVSMKLRQVLSYPVREKPSLPRAQFVILIIALLFMKGGDILEYGKNNPIIAGAFLLLFFFLMHKMANKQQQQEQQQQESKQK